MALVSRYKFLDDGFECCGFILLSILLQLLPNMVRIQVFCLAGSKWELLPVSKVVVPGRVPNGGIPVFHGAAKNNLNQKPFCWKYGTNVGAYALPFFLAERADLVINWDVAILAPIDDRTLNLRALPTKWAIR